MYHFVGVFHVAVGHLRNMHKSVLMHADVDKCSEVGDVGDDAGEHHSLNEIVHLFHIGVELEGFQLLSRVAPRFFQFVHDIRQGGNTHLGRHVSLHLHLLALLFVSNQFAYGTTVVARHLFHDVVALGVDGRIVERVLGIGNAKESGTLQESRGAKSRHFLQLGTRSKGTILAAIVDDVLGQCRSESADVHQQMLGGGVQVDAHLVDATLDGLVERVLQLRLVNVVLILSHADALRVYFHQFCQRVHQPAPDADGSAHGDVLVGKLLAGNL